MVGATCLRVRRWVGWGAGLMLLTLSGCEPTVFVQDPPELGESAPCHGGWTMRDAREAGTVDLDPHGVPSFLSGQLGCLADGPVDLAAWQFMAELRPLLTASGDEELVIVDTVTDELGQVHVRFQEYLHGLEVVGGTYIVHASPTTGAVLAAGGRFVPGTGLPQAASLAADDALGVALAQAGIDSATAAGPPVLVYVTTEDVQGALAWSQHIRYTANDEEELDRVFADANTGAFLARHPQYMRGKNRRVYDGNNSASLPGSLAISEGGSSSDPVEQDAYDYVGDTYDFYWDNFGRDSYTGSGSTIRATVHHRVSYNNAFWNGSQLVFGDGDGNYFGPLGQALDIVAHEFTHGVISYSANLTYHGESGALNEGMADILGASAEAYADGGVSLNTWKLAEDVWTPGSSGDAMRYMHNPTADGSSYDYYPERYTGSSDNGGVHWNSGIANLAFVLLTQGGTHPRGKTSVDVPGIGIDKAQQIFYRALNVYMTSSTDFGEARDHTAQAASDLYGAAEVDAVHKAWDAVGVPGSPGNTDPNPTVTELNNGVAVSGLSGSQGDWRYYVISVPAGQDTLEISISGGSGDADLYVRDGDLPTTSAYDYRPWLNGNNETVTVQNPASGDWYVGVHGYSSYSGVTLVAEYGGAGGGNPDPDPSTPNLEGGVTESDLDGGQGSWQHFKIEVPTGTSTFTVELSGGSGDADVYVRYGARSTTSDYDHRPYLWGNEETVTVDNPTAGWWYVSLRGYNAYANTTLTAAY